MRRFVPFVFIALLSSGSLSTATAEEMDHDGLHVAHGWARASLGKNPNSAAYVTIHNKAETGDRLLDVSCAGAQRCSLHNHTTVSDVTRMEAVGSLELIPGAHIEFKPGGYHIMMFDLKAPLAPGGETQLTFSFEKAGDMTVTVPVLSMREAAERVRHKEHDEKEH